MWRVITSLTAMFGLLSGVHAADLAVVGTIDVAKVGAFKKPKKSFEQSHNMSGMFCPDADWCLVVSDELQGLHRLKVDRTGELPLLSYDTALTFDPPGQEFLTGHGMAGTDFEELDLEAIASDGDSVIFLGSHANKRNSGATNPTAHLVAIANTAALKTSATATPQWASLDKLFQKEGMFPDALYKQLQCGGVNIEGATVFDGNLLIGLRSPTHGTDGSTPGAFIISTPLAGLAGEDFSQATLRVLPTEAPLIGIRAMETVDDSVVIVTGDAGVNDLKAGVTMECAANINKEDPARPFELRAWKPNDGNVLAPRPLVTFDQVTEKDFDGEDVRAKVEGIASDPGRPNAFFVLYDGSAEVRYLTDITLP